ncbi:MAG: hypothetical protein WBF75_14275, partial [Pseudonocardiaceae bacterium]
GHRPPGLPNPRRDGEVPPTVAVLRSGRPYRVAGRAAVDGHHPRAGDPIPGWPPVELSPTPRSRRPAGPCPPSNKPTGGPAATGPTSRAGHDPSPAREKRRQP